MWLSHTHIKPTSNFVVSPPPPPPPQFFLTKEVQDKCTYCSSAKYVPTYVRTYMYVHVRIKTRNSSPSPDKIRTKVSKVRYTNSNTFSHEINFQTVRTIFQMLLHAHRQLTSEQRNSLMLDLKTLRPSAWRE